ncbi:MAG: type I-B CRISPR-associated protein Cas7/Csh2 [Blastocatellia bacterium]|nr:type I-B CRISPR-associated protein Cas7/Csh2 [Blastocatellia bacterium]MDW8166899.1 type I-B CRISPR-associated protein Cas7/Csh2 [Acidobacteriota bacterium]
MGTYRYRSEILFLYDVFRCNPNGDPFENRPRQDPETGRIDVTDVRLKRTIRDYILRYKHRDPNDGLEIFVRVADEKALTAERRYEEIFGELPEAGNVEEAKKQLIEKCVDVRMFGGLVPITEKKPTKSKKAESEATAKGEAGGESGGIQLTGAVQFNPGQSLHAAEIIEIAGTGGFASKETAKQKTFRREFIVPYALIGFYGVINENLAKETGLTEDDVNLLMEAIWKGTLSLHSRSKAFHHPRLLLRFDFKDEVQCGYFLDRIELDHDLGDERRIRSPKDYVVKLDRVLEIVGQRKEHLARAECWIDAGLRLSPEELRAKITELLHGEESNLSFKAF